MQSQCLGPRSRCGRAIYTLESPEAPQTQKHRTPRLQSSDIHLPLPARFAAKVPPDEMDVVRVCCFGLLCCRSCKQGCLALILCMLRASAYFRNSASLRTFLIGTAPSLALAPFLARCQGGSRLSSGKCPELSLEDAAEGSVLSMACKSCRAPFDKACGHGL